jgi:hypothetical protein
VASVAVSADANTTHHSAWGKKKKKQSRWFGFAALFSACFFSLPGYFPVLEMFAAWDASTKAALYYSCEVYTDVTATAACGLLLVLVSALLDLVRVSQLMAHAHKLMAIISSA